MITAVFCLCLLVMLPTNLASNITSGVPLVSDQEVSRFLTEVKNFNSIHTTNSLVAASTHNSSKSPVGEISEHTGTKNDSLEFILDSPTWLVILSVAAGLSSAVLILAVVVVCRYVIHRRQPKDLSLNKDLNRWDPQLLRPTKANIEAFIFGPPIPSVSEVIKKGYCENTRTTVIPNYSTEVVHEKD